MVYNRAWFANDLIGVTLGGGAMANPGRYLVLLPPINGATAASGTPYFTQNPGDPFRAWMHRSRSTTCRISSRRFAPSGIIARPTFRISPAGGAVTPAGGNTGPAGSIVPGFTPDLRKTETRFLLSMMIKL